MSVAICENKWQARARVKGRMKRHTFLASSLLEAQNKARILFPRHKPNNIILSFDFILIKNKNK